MSPHLILPNSRMHRLYHPRFTGEQVEVQLARAAHPKALLLLGVELDLIPGMALELGN